MSTLAEEYEQDKKFRRNGIDNAKQIFDTRGSAGNGNEKLSRILAGWQLFIKIMQWDDKPLADLTSFVAQQQGSIDAKYHNDYKDILIAKEIEDRKRNRQGVSITQAFNE